MYLRKHTKATVHLFTVMLSVCVCDQHHDQMTSLESPAAGVQRASRVSYPQYFPPPLNSWVDHAVLICELCNCVRQCVLFLFHNIWNADV